MYKVFPSFYYRGGKFKPPQSNYFGGMMIRTTISIAGDVHQKLKEAAEKRGVDIEDIILALMRCFSKKHRKEMAAWNAVKYQERNDESLRECVHVRWFGDEYEFLIDMRKVHKKSVSYLVAETVVMFIDENGSIIDGIFDNNQHHSYAIAKFSVQNIIGCIFLWGFPKNSP